MTKTKTKTKTEITTTTRTPLQTLGTGDWLKGPMVQALRAKYGTDREAGQRGADYLVSSGMVQIPPGMILKAVGIRRFGGALGFVVTAPGEAKAPALKIDGLPD